MEMGIATCPVCKMRVLPPEDQRCPSCHAYDFGLGQVVSEQAADQARKRVEAAAKPAASLHPLSVVSAVLALFSMFSGPYPAIGAGLLAGGAGWWASRDIRTMGGPRWGLWVSRAGLVVGVGVAIAWAIVLLVAKYKAK
jgi:hypothetical protein